MVTQPKEFAEFEAMEVSESLKMGLGRALSQRAKEVGRAHQDRQRQLARAFHKSDRFYGGVEEKVKRLKAIKTTVSPLPQQEMKKEITDEQKAALRNYRAWAWARKQGLIIKTGRVR